MLAVSFNNEFVTVTVHIYDSTLFDMARELANEQGLNIQDFKNGTIEM